jgi:hypothetical protein
MASLDVKPEDVQVHADVLALVEAAVDAGRSLPWSMLLVAAIAVNTDGPLTGLSALDGRSVSTAMRDAATDLLDLGLLATTPDGFTVTDQGRDQARQWNGAFSERLAAALALLKSTGFAAA